MLKGTSPLTGRVRILFGVLAGFPGLDLFILLFFLAGAVPGGTGC